MKTITFILKALCHLLKILKKPKIYPVIYNQVYILESSKEDFNYLSSHLYSQNQNNFGMITSSNDDNNRYLIKNNITLNRHF